MPQLNPDDAANDEPKTYNDEASGVYDSNDLNDIKGDLVDEDDGDPMRAYTKKSAIRMEDSKHPEVERDQVHEAGNGKDNFRFSQENVDSLVTSLNRPAFQDRFMPPSSQVPYSHCMPPYMGSFFPGGPSPLERDGKQGMPRLPYTDVPSMYPLPGQLGQIPNPLVPWASPHLHPLCTASAMAGMLRYPYPFHSFTSSGAVRNVSPFPLVPPHGNGIHSSLLHRGHLPLSPHVNGYNSIGKPLSEKKHMDSSKRGRSTEKSKQPYVKKPLNAFMLYMKEQRAKVVAECTLKESAAINQILGKKWHNLDKEEQQKYYDMARKERQLHMQKHPSWSARDNYGKKKKRKKEKSQDCTGPSAKKCRAVFGLEQQQLWCAPCRRKKKCIRNPHDEDDSDDSDDSPHYDDSPPQANLTPNCVSQPLAGDSNSNCNVSQSHIASERLSSAAEVKQERNSPKFFSLRQNCCDSQQPPVGRRPPTPPTKRSSNKAVEGAATTSQLGFEDSLRFLTNNFSTAQQASDVRMNRTSSNSETSLNSCSGAAAGLPPSPLGGLMGFPAFNGLTSPLHMGLNPPGTAVGPVGRLTTSDSRLSGSALEGRS